MPVPDYQEFMLLILRLASDRQEHRLRDTAETIADEFHVSETHREQLLPSGRHVVLASVAPVQ